MQMYVFFIHNKMGGIYPLFGALVKGSGKLHSIPLSFLPWKPGRVIGSSYALVSQQWNRDNTLSQGTIGIDV